MKYQIHLTFDNKRDRNAWVKLIHACMEKMEEIELEWDEE